MSVSMNLVHSINAEEIKGMNFLGLQISNIFNKSTDKTVQITELTKELLGSKKETSQETEVALLASKYSSFIGEKPLKLFAMSLHKLPANPLEMGLEYIREAPGYDPVRGFRVPNDWEKEGTVTLNQIYKEQFFAWIVKNHELPFSSILLMLRILQSFDDSSIKLDNQIWDKFLLTKERQKQLKEFRSKYEFLTENKFLHFFPIKLEKIKFIRDIQKPIHHQCELFKETFIWLAEQFLEDVRVPNTAQKLKKYLEILSTNLSKKVLAYKLKRRLVSFLKHLNQQIELFEKKKTRLKQLKASQWEVSKVLKICKEKREQISNRNTQSIAKGRKKRDKHRTVEFNIQNIMKDLLKQYAQSASVEREAQFNRQLHSILKEQMTTLKHVQETEDFFLSQDTRIQKDKEAAQKELSTNKHLLEDLSCARFLISYMDTDLARKQAQWKEERWGLSMNQFDGMLLEKEFVAESKASSEASKNPQKPLDFSDEEKPISSEEEESEEEESVSPTATAPQFYADKQMQFYLSSRVKNKQLDGCLSQSIESFLQQIKPYLYRGQGKEVYDHALLGAAALEHMAQAIYEGRIEDVVLGFRSGLIHCHFAVEQMLNQKIFQKTGKIMDSHHLTFLATTLEANTQKPFSQEDRRFLEEIRVHLWFHYPEDYELYFAHNKVIPKAFSLLKTLFQPRISKENVQAAMKFSFEKYCQTLEFITKLSEAPVQNTVELFKNNINDLQKHLHTVPLEPRKLLVTKSLLINKMDQVLEELNLLNQLIHIKDLEYGWLLAIFDTIKSYLQLMKISLRTPPEATTHSLQKFIQVETLLNMERLFKNLFRAISFLHLERDIQMHGLNKSYSIIQEFYGKPLSEEHRSLLKSINLGITHHYLHKKSYASLKNIYSNFLDEARSLSSVDEEFSHVTAKNGNISAMGLQKKMKEDGQIMQTMDKSLDLFRNLLHPVIVEMQKINNEIDKEFNGLKIG